MLCKGKAGKPCQQLPSHLTHLAGRRPLSRLRGAGRASGPSSEEEENADSDGADQEESVDEPRPPEPVGGGCGGGSGGRFT